MVSTDVILPVISCKLQLLSFINLASVPGRQLVNYPTAAILERKRSYNKMTNPKIIEVIKKIILFSFIVTIVICAKAQENLNQIYLKDSISTVKYLSNLSICEKIDFAEKNINDVIKSKGFSYLILISIAKEAKTKIEIRSINGNMVVPEERLIVELREQFNDIKIKKGCRI